MVPVTSATTVMAGTVVGRTDADRGHGDAGYVLRTATADDLGGARAVMLDTVYRDLKSGYVPRWHADIIDLRAAYLRPERCTLLVVEHRGEIVATGAVRDRGPQAPPNPPWVAERFPSGTTAQLCRIYVRPEHRRHGLARQLVRELGSSPYGPGATRRSTCTPTPPCRAPSPSGVRWPRRCATSGPCPGAGRGSSTSSCRCPGPPRFPAVPPGPPPPVR